MDPTEFNHPFISLSHWVMSTQMCPPFLPMGHFLPALQHREAVVRIPDAYSRYNSFKHRLWFTWYIWSVAQQGNKKSLPWTAVVCGADANGDLWFWEDADENYIKEFTEDLALDSLPEMPAADWDDAFRALEARRRSQRRTSAGPLAQLTPPNRLRFIAWLIVAGPVRKAQISRGDFQSLEFCIKRWGTCMSFHGSDEPDPYAEACTICGVSDLLATWLETMRQMYLLDDLRSIPWYHACGCWERHLYAVSHSAQRETTQWQQSLQKDSAALRVLYELVVSPWPLILWVNFRTVVHDRPNHVQTFLDILRGPEVDLFARDDGDDSDLYRILVKEDGRLGLYPCEWSQFMVEIDLKTWLQISNMTWTVSRPGRGLSDNMKIHLVAVYSSTSISADNILAPLDIHFNHFPFTSIAGVRDQERLTLTNIESEDFWASANLENWLSSQSESLCHAVWHTSPRMSVRSLLVSAHLKRFNFKMNRTWPCMHILSGCNSPIMAED
ncbi:hypothetical protein B0H12DRAFT_101006 [Mycena haematopus]|nr:hypothetical protein B0H12DRAFT_101006 [Mycena haematopus]